MSSRKLTFAIIITTKNRRDDLYFTLKNIISLNLSHLPIYIIDDASDFEIIGEDITKQFLCIHLKRNESSRGLIVNRNELAKWAVEDILISLDDDSCFEYIPDLAAVAKRFEEDETLCGVEFKNRELSNIATEHVPDRTWLQMYTGFGHAIHRERFLIVGGYREYFIHMCEERDLAQRAWRMGMHVEMCYAGQILHRRTPVARLLDRNTYFLVRNTIIFSALNMLKIRWIWFVYAPFAMTLLWEQTKGRRLLALRAVIDGIATAWRNRKDCSQLTIIRASQYRKLPLMGHWERKN